MAVVLIHTCPKGECWQVFFRPFINFGVPLFIFLSGYLTRTSYDDWKSFYSRRLLRVDVPYCIWTVIYTLDTLVSGNIGALPYNLLTASATYTLYYLFVYMQLVLLAPLSGMLATSRFWWTGLLVTPVSYLLQLCIGLGGVQVSDVLSLMYWRSFLGWYSYFYIGLLLGNRLKTPNMRISIICALLLLSIPLQFLEAMAWQRWGIPDIGTPLKLSGLLTNSLLMLVFGSLLSSYGKSDSCGLTQKNYLVSMGDLSFGI